MSKSPRKPDPKPVSEPSNDDQDQVAPLRTPQAARWTLLVLTIIALILLALITKPFAGALFVAAVMAGATYPWSARLAVRMRGRRNLAAGLTTIGIVLVVVLPLALISVTVARQASDGVRYVKKTLRSEGVEPVFDRSGHGLPGLASPDDVELRAVSGQGEVHVAATQPQIGRAHV